MEELAKMKLAVSKPTEPQHQEPSTTRESLPIRSLGGDQWGPPDSIDSKLETLFEKMRKSYQNPSFASEDNSTSGAQTLFEAFHSYKNSPIPRMLDTANPSAGKCATILKEPEDYAEPFVNFMTENPTVWHAIQYWENKLEGAGFTKVSATPVQVYASQSNPNNNANINLFIALSA